MPKKRYVLKLNKTGLQEVVFSYPPKRRNRRKSKALRAGVLTRLVYKLINRKNSDQ
jgi:hypothetical protein